MIRLGTCSWADAGLLASWYPPSVRTPESRLAHYAERFDVVEVDSPFYRLPSPGTTARWAERTPDRFTFHVKASGEMTGHRPADLERAVREFREAVAPLEASGKLRGVLLQYPPWVAKSREAAKTILETAVLLEPLVPLVEFRHASWLSAGELPTTLELCRRNGLAFVSLDAPANALPLVAEATHGVAYVRFHGRNQETWFMGWRLRAGSSRSRRSRRSSRLRGRQVGSARPVVPRAGVVERAIARGLQNLHCRRRANARMAVRHDLRALRLADELADLLDGARRHQPAELQVPRRRDMALPRVAGIAGRARVLALAADVDEDDPTEAGVEAVCVDLHDKVVACRRW